jgi:transposase
MAGRYELSDAQWQRIAHLLPGKPGDRGRTGTDNRLFVNASLIGVREVKLLLIVL